jgi:hypothetical protein
LLLDQRWRLDAAILSPVTQQFNTTTIDNGRLLTFEDFALESDLADIAFAQFEREVTSERIRACPLRGRTPKAGPADAQRVAVEPTTATGN